MIGSIDGSDRSDLQPAVLPSHKPSTTSADATVRQAQDRIEHGAARVSQHVPATSYTPSPGCEPVERRDDPGAEARSVARLAVARAMDFAHSDQGRKLMETNGDGYLNVVGEYMNSAFAQRCNPIRVQLHNGSLSGHDAEGHSVNVSGNENATAIAMNLGHVADANVHLSYDHNSLVQESMRQPDGSYRRPTEFFGPGANYVMRYHGLINTDESMSP